MSLRGAPVKTVRIEFPDEEADALERAAVECGFTSTADLARAAIEEFLAAPPEHDPESFESDIVEYEAEQARGEPTLSAEEARARLREAAANRR
jgi:hypothetical protein